MESILPYLIWGGLFFLMMRFGCGSHLFGHRHGDQAQAGHGGRSCCGSSPGNPAKDRKGLQVRPVPPLLHRDPVCGKSVAVDAAKTSVHAGTIHYFCSRDCREIFETAPETYLAGDASLDSETIPMLQDRPLAKERDGHPTL